MGRGWGSSAASASLCCGEETVPRNNRLHENGGSFNPVGAPRVSPEGCYSTQAGHLPPRPPPSTHDSIAFSHSTSSNRAAQQKTVNRLSDLTTLPLVLILCSEPSKLCPIYILWAKRLFQRQRKLLDRTSSESPRCVAVCNSMASSAASHAVEDPPVSNVAPPCI